jgi:hypothetical protein
MFARVVALETVASARRKGVVMPLNIPEAMLIEATRQAAAASARRLNVNEADITGEARAALSGSVQKALEEQFVGASTRQPANP